jgi:hypothetical protein
VVWTSRLAARRRSTGRCWHRDPLFSLLVDRAIASRSSAALLARLNDRSSEISEVLARVRIWPDYSRLPVRGAESIRINNPLTNSGYDCGYAAVSVKPKAALNQHPVSSRSTPAGGARPSSKDNEMQARITTGRSASMSAGG